MKEKITIPNTASITVEALIQAPVSKVWKFWIGPEHITKWNSASEDWHTPFAENDVREGGKFKSTMAARDGSMGFDFEGTYTLVKQEEQLEYEMADGRKVSVLFQAKGNETKLIETFAPETMNPLELQRAGWQAILNNFKKYTEETNG